MLCMMCILYIYIYIYVCIYILVLLCVMYIYCRNMYIYKQLSSSYMHIDNVCACV